MAMTGKQKSCSVYGGMDRTRWLFTDLLFNSTHPNEKLSDIELRLTYGNCMTRV